MHTPDPLRRHLVVLGGPAPTALPPGCWTTITAVDGGGNLLHRLGIAAHRVVGDGDSITEEAAAFHEQGGAVFDRYPRDKDETDFELALNRLDSTAADEVHLVGLAGGRSDMSFGNLLVLGGRTRRGLFTFDLPDGCGGVMGPGSLEITVPEGTAAALLSLSPLTSGIVSEGVRWPLANGSIGLHEARGVSNLVTRPPWRLGHQSGSLLWLLGGVSRRGIGLSWRPA
ncbi:MAG TPA: thiamine diphosphokinase [Candidatus Ozemobacteraceae bacterium]|nr:thiamine diphosphokinase [Candidatus Ozemobacteraceae bacterium]